MTITARSTKAQLLEHITHLEQATALAEQQIAAMQPTPKKELAAQFFNELVWFCKDVYRLGAWCRKGFDQVLTELRSLV